MKQFFKRILSIVLYAKEELATIVNDRAVLLIFVIANVIYPLVYSIAYKNEQVKEVKVALVDLDKTSASRQLQRMIDATEGISIGYEVTGLEEAENLFYYSDVQGIVLLPKGLEKDLLSGRQSSVSIYADASYFLLYKQVYASVVKAYSTYSGGAQLKKSMAKGKSYEEAFKLLNPIAFKTIELYNPNSSYGSFVMPSIILVILQQTLLIGIGILGGSRKEVQRYNFMLPVGDNRKKILPFILGKAFAYFITFMVIGVFTLVWVHHWFGFPDKSGYFELLSLYIPFIIANIFLGMSFSVFFRRRENAMLFMVFLSIPVLFLSGASWPVEAIPPLLHKLASIFPTTYMVPAYQRVRTMGAELHHVQEEVYAMLIQCIVYFGLAMLSFRLVLSRLKEHPMSENGPTKAL
jgi:ABC-2 type transport system permease protein